MVSDIDFEVNIAPAMVFIGHYLYGLKTKEFKPTTRISNLQAECTPLEEQTAPKNGEIVVQVIYFIYFDGKYQICPPTVESDSQVTNLHTECR